VEFDGAIHRSAGTQLLDECRTLKGCEIGSAKITKGYQLPAKYVIHTVGPIWHGGNGIEPELLRSCYTTSLQLAKEQHCQSIAFPNISTGIYRFPKQNAALIAIGAVNVFLNENKLPKEIFFVCFDTENYEIYRRIVFNY